MNDQIVNNTPGEEKSVLPLLSMIFGIASLVLPTVLFCCYGYLLGLPLGIAAIVIAMVCKNKNIEFNAKFRTVGLYTGIGGVVVSIIATIIGLIVVGAALADLSEFM